jgi:hypothetical protein
MMTKSRTTVDVDVHTPNAARIYDYLLEEG